MNTLLRALGLFLVCGGFALARVNVNTATQAELEALPQVGPVKAKAILDFRKKNGPFKALEDLEKVPGVGPVTIKAIKNEVSFSGVSTPPVSAKKPGNTDAAPKLPMDKAPAAKPPVPAAAAATASSKAKPVDGADRDRGKGNDKAPGGKANDALGSKGKDKTMNKTRPQ